MAVSAVPKNAALVRLSPRALCRAEEKELNEEAI
jgi:hypothetical protein